MRKINQITLRELIIIIVLFTIFDPMNVAYACLGPGHCEMIGWSTYKLIYDGCDCNNDVCGGQKIFAMDLNCRQDGCEDPDICKQNNETDRQEVENLFVFQACIGDCNEVGDCYVRFNGRENGWDYTKCHCD